MSEFKRAKVLVIDGEAGARSMICESLAARGAEVHATADPDEGIEKAMALRPDLIFMSLLFPDSNGLKLSKLIRSMEGLREVPVIMLISYQGELDPKYTSTIGIVDVLVKPLTQDDIVSKTLNILGQDAISEVAEAVIAEEPPAVEEKEAVEEEETAVPGAAAMEAEVFSAGPGGGEELPTDDEIPGEPGAEGGEMISRGISSKMARREIVAAGAILIIAVIGISAYVMKKVFYPSGSGMAPISSPTTGTETKGVQKAAPAGAVSGNEEKAGKAGQKTKSPYPAVQGKEKKAPASSVKVTPQKAVHDAVGKGAIFSLQVGAFSREQNAAALVGKLKKRGYDAFISKDDARQVYRVLVGRFADRSKASKQAGLLEKEGIKSIIFRSRD